MEQAQQVFKVGQKYRKEEILEHFRQFNKVDFTDKRNGKPVLIVSLGDKEYEFVQDGRKFKLV